FWEQSRPWVESGKVQIRHVLVGVISESSPYKAAAILAADDPEQAYLENENNFEDNGIQPLDEIPSAIRDQLVANQQLMHQLGIRGTPGIFYKDAEGRVHTQRGVPQGNVLEEILGASSNTASQQTRSPLGTDGVAVCTARLCVLGHNGRNRVQVEFRPTDPDLRGQYAILAAAESA